MPSQWEALADEDLIGPIEDLGPGRGTVVTMRGAGPPGQEPHGRPRVPVKSGRMCPPLFRGRLAGSCSHRFNVFKSFYQQEGRVPGPVTGLA